MVHSVPNSEQALREECGLRCVDKVRGTGATLYSCSGLRPACLVRGPPAHSGSSLLWGWWDLQQALSLVNGGGDSSAQARDRCWDRVGQAPACACVRVCVCGIPHLCKRGRAAWAAPAVRGSGPPAQAPSPDCRAQNVGLEARPGPRSLPLSAHPPRLPFSSLLNTSSCWAVTFSPALHF